MACFSCNENKDENQVTILQMYKDLFDKTGTGYMFFKKIGTNNLQIMTTNDFRKFKKRNQSDFKKEYYEFAHISEFRIVENTGVLESDGK